MTKMGFLINENSHDNTMDTAIQKQDFRHVLITGKTGSGKTATLVLPILENRIKANNSIIFFEYKGHEHRKIKALAFNEDRLSDVVELGKPTGCFFNIMGMFDNNMISKVIKQLCGGESKDPYWAMSASQLTVRIIELYRKLQRLGHVLEQEFNVDGRIFMIHLGSDILSINEDASFSTLSKIIKTPSSMNNYFDYYKKLILKLNKIVESIGKSQPNSQIDILRIEKMLSQFLLFKELVGKYAHFTVQDSDESSGNNGVLQILNNAISTLATQDYLNNNESDILKMVENNAIIIIDTQSISSHVYSVFTEALLQKLSTRIKYQIPKAVSIFLDEANRVLTKEIDLYNDVLRESMVELILAIQNEKQMILKFGEIKWESIIDNIGHIYYIEPSHDVYYNDKKVAQLYPMIFDNDSLNVIEYKYNNFEKNLEFINKRFMFEGVLPLKFNIIYDLDAFSQNEVLTLSSSDGQHIFIHYVGESIKNQTKAIIENAKAKFAIERIVQNSSPF